MKRVTDGISRTVFVVGKYAIKVPNGRYGLRYWLRGLLANQQERQWGRSGLAGLCPVLFADPIGFVVVMPRVDVLRIPLSGHDWNRLIDRGEYKIPAEAKPDSWGFYHGELVAIDYGN